MGTADVPESCRCLKHIEAETKWTTFRKRIFFNENVWISIKISLKFVPKGPINNIPALVQIMAWCHSGDKPLYEPKMVSLPTHICVARHQWVDPRFPWNGMICSSSKYVTWNLRYHIHIHYWKIMKPHLLKNPFCNRDFWVSFMFN